jgi:hypothetical protein
MEKKTRAQKVHAASSSCAFDRPTMHQMFLVLAVALLCCVTVDAFAFGVSRLARVHRHSLAQSSTDGADVTRPTSPAAPASKGFGAPKAKVEKPEEEKDAGTMTYEAQAKRGVPEYNIFLRPTNGSVEEWVPVGSMTIPRDTSVAKAVFEVEQELLKGAFKLYPKLKAFYDVRAEKDGVFEYGSCLKAFPDEEIKVLTKEVPKESGNFFSTWLGKITNPLDTEDLKNKGQMTINQTK